MEILHHQIDWEEDMQQLLDLMEIVNTPSMGNVSNQNEDKKTPSYASDLTTPLNSPYIHETAYSTAHESVYTRQRKLIVCKANCNSIHFIFLYILVL